MLNKKLKEKDIMIDKLLNKKNLFILITILSIFSLAIAYYAELFQHQKPCPLCLIQRIIIFTITIIASLSIFIKIKVVNYFNSLLIFVLSFLGIKIALKHYHIMHLPPDKQIYSCGLPLKVMFQTLPFNEFIQNILNGDTECTTITWTILGYSPPTMLIVFYLIVILILLFTFFTKK